MLSLASGGYSEESQGRSERPFHLPVRERRDRLQPASELRRLAASASDRSCKLQWPVNSSLRSIGRGTQLGGGPGAPRGVGDAPETAGFANFHPLHQIVYRQDGISPLALEEAGAGVGPGRPGVPIAQFTGDGTARRARLLIPTGVFTVAGCSLREAVWCRGDLAGARPVVGQAEHAGPSRKRPPATGRGDQAHRY